MTMGPEANFAGDDKPARQVRFAPRQFVALGLVTLLFVGASLCLGEFNFAGRSLRIVVVRNATSSATASAGLVTAHREHGDAPPWLLPSACQRRQIIEGQWVPEHLDQPPYRPIGESPEGCRIRGAASPPEGGWDTYKWAPHAAANSSCQFSDWDADAFCALAKYSTVLVVGDTLSYEHYSSLAHLLGQPVDGTYQMMSAAFGMNIGISVCGGMSRIAYRRDDYLDNVRHALLEGESNVPQVLVLNRGAHYEGDQEFMSGIRSTLGVVEEWLSTCDEMKIKCHFFWRTTVPGHNHCTQFEAPVNDKAMIEAYIANLSLYDATTLRYHWYDFQHQNLLVEAELRRRGVVHQILDGYHINVLRPDQHIDCLHSCLPGKMDVYNQLLLHYLRRDRSPADVESLRAVFEGGHWSISETTAIFRNSTYQQVGNRLRAEDRRRNPGR